MKLIYILLALAFIKSVLLYRTYHALPQTELKRRAQANDPKAAAIYKLTGFKKSLDLVIWLAGLCSAVVLILWSAATAWWLGAAVVLVEVWLVAFGPRPKVGGWLWAYVAWTSPLTFKILNFLQPVLKPVVALLPNNLHTQRHSELYEKEDLLQFINTQNYQPGSRIDEADLKKAFSVLTFADKKVDQIMTPRVKAKFVSFNEPIGPMLMDELHKTGQVRFAVTKEPVKKSTPQIIGSLYLGDLLKNLEKQGEVADIMQPATNFINEENSLNQALDAFLKTHSQLLVAVNNSQEITGILTLDNLLQQILGAPPVYDFNHYDSLPAVAGMEVKKPQALPDDHSELKTTKN